MSRWEPKEEIFNKIIKKVEDAADYLETFGCLGPFDVKDALLKANELWKRLNAEEVEELSNLAPTIEMAAAEVRLSCREVPFVKNEAQVYRRQKRRKIIMEMEKK
ncbi:MAG: hypothetical protein K6T73_11450 [Candidatus Bathyarchaeota archaeon]|nr:hypothetical protein [Candidatus Bathyarchaeota archaeon]